VAVVHPRGVIIMASQVPDQNGTNAKDRHVRLLIDFHDTDHGRLRGGDHGTFTPPLAPMRIPLPYQRQGNCQTGLSKPSVAVCDWPVVVGKADIMSRAGTCPRLCPSI